MSATDDAAIWVGYNSTTGQSKFRVSDTGKMNCTEAQVGPLRLGPQSDVVGDTDTTISYYDGSRYWAGVDGTADLILQNFTKVVTLTFKQGLLVGWATKEITDS